MHLLAQIGVLLFITFSTSWSIANVAHRGIPSSLYTIPIHSWTIAKHDPVAMIVHDSTRFSLDTDAGAKAYEDMLPNGHLVHVGENWKPHTVSMLHQLRCLQIIGETYLSPGRNKSRELSEHCLNYLRQMFLCRPSLQLESIRTDARGESQTSRPYETVCNDWTAVYDAVEKNNKIYENARSLQRAG